MENGICNFRPSLVGRQREATLLWSRFEAAIHGRCGVTCVTGEPGIGKTRLLKEVAARALHAGAVVLRGGASAAEGMPPYLPFVVNYHHLWWWLEMMHLEGALLPVN